MYKFDVYFISRNTGFPLLDNIYDLPFSKCVILHLRSFGCFTFPDAEHVPQALSYDLNLQ